VRGVAGINIANEDVFMQSAETVWCLSASQDIVVSRTALCQKISLLISSILFLHSGSELQY